MPYKDKEKAREWRRQNRIKHRDYLRAWVAKQRLLGLCVVCHQPKLENSVYCLYHLDYHRRKIRCYNGDDLIRVKNQVYAKNRRLTLQSENKCLDCGMPLNSESRMGNRCINCYSRSHIGG